MHFDVRRGLCDGDAGCPWPELAVLGDPVAHSLSPALHNAALDARRIPGVYRAVRVAPTDLGPALEAASAAGVRGLNLTLPHKEAALALISRRSDECDRIGATNTLVMRGGVWMAHNTDARGLAMALQRALGAGLPRYLHRSVILGTGGAARAAAHALEGLGAREIVVAGRHPERATWAADCSALACAWEDAPVGTATLVLNCTPLGLRRADPPPLEPASIHPDAHLVDLTYSEAPSALRAGFPGQSQDGRPMLVAQAALAFSVWFGALPPLVEMAAAIGMDW